MKNFKTNALILVLFMLTRISYGQFSKTYTMGTYVVTDDDNLVRNTILTDDGAGNSGVTVTVSTVTEVNNPNKTDILVTKLNASGGLIWNKRYGTIGVSEKAASIAVNICQTEYVITGETESANGGTMSLAFKMTADGLAILWNRTYFQIFNTSRATIVTTAPVIANNQYIIAGWGITNGVNHMYIMNIDDYGAIIWAKMYK
ncbi:MAG: hypothetical protein HYZ42_00140 [Bacteroidetes bacterium]|nr:hypothetical protein [Bacteroidota bacterium]